MNSIFEAYQSVKLEEATDDDINRVAKQYPSIDRDVIKTYSENADPKPGKGSRYIDWIVKGHSNKNHHFEDSERIKTALANFEKHKQKLDKKDINQYKTISEVEDAVAPHLGAVSKTAAMKDSTYWENPEHHEKIFDNGKGLKVYHTKTKEASQAIYGGGHTAGGTHTSWCTAGRSEQCRFDQYSKKGENPLYQIHTPDGKVYQDEFSGDWSGGLRDAADNKVQREDLVKEHPDLSKVPAFQGKDLSYSHGKHLSDALHNEIKKGNYSTVIKHPEVKTEHINSVLENGVHMSPEDIIGALTHQKSDEQSISHAIKRLQYSNVSDKILEHPKFNENHIQEIIKNPEFMGIKSDLFNSNKVTHQHVRDAIESGVQSSIDPALHSHAATDEDRKEVALNPDLKNIHSAFSSMKSPEVIHDTYNKLGEHKSTAESAIGDNQNSSAETLKQVYHNTKTDYLKNTIVKHKSAPVDLIDTHLKSTNEDNKVNLLKNKINASTEHLDTYKDSKNHMLKQAILLHPNASKEFHEAHIDDQSFHGAISNSVSAHPEHLAKLASSKFDFVRENVAKNKNTPKETLETLKSDANSDVATAAEKSFKKKK